MASEKGPSILSDVRAGAGAEDSDFCLYVLDVVLARLEINLEATIRSEHAAWSDSAWTGGAHELDCDYVSGGFLNAFVYDTKTSSYAPSVSHGSTDRE